jgi:hypothetical protein
MAPLPRFVFTLSFAVALLCSCSNLSTKAVGTWKGNIMNGDKVFGSLELKIDAYKLYTLKILTTEKLSVKESNDVMDAGKYVLTLESHKELGSLAKKGDALVLKPDSCGYYQDLDISCDTRTVAFKDNGLLLSIGKKQVSLSRSAQ